MKTIHPLQRPSLLIFGLFFGLSSVFCFGQDLPHSSPSTGADGALFFSSVPGDRHMHSMVYDPVRDVVVLFGGYTDSYNNETWEYDGTSWTQRTTSTSPSVRGYYSMVYDPVRNLIILFGGYNGSYNNETWEYDGADWTQRTPATGTLTTSPSARGYHSMVYDSVRNVVVLFGGFPTNNETWEYDGTNWTQQTPTTSPSARYTHTMAYDPVREVTVLFGGTSGGDQTWEYDGSDWVEVTPTVSPSGRTFSSMAYDSTRNVMVLLGGASGGDETWEYDGTSWTQKTPATSPSARGYHSMIYDPDRDVVVTYGGYDGSTVNDETWEYDGSDWTEVASVAGTRTINMADKPDGIWNWTSIYVGKNVTVNFVLDVISTPPVQWLATEDVTIDGTLNLDGEPGVTYNRLTPSIPGPGGYAGGLGGEEFEVSGSYAGTPGLGPAGGAPGTTNRGFGQPATSYGNAFLQPLTGGSGGGGSGSVNSHDGHSGGAGGGAILIDTSRDLNINGVISARGGNRAGTGSFGSTLVSGGGAGGMIRLLADRIAGEGILRATGANGAANGRIRLEAYYRDFPAGNSANSNPIATGSAPVENPIPVGNEPQLVITSVDGAAVANPPTGSLTSTDVVFSDAGPVDIVVNATNVPDGSEVNLNVFVSGETIVAGPQTLAGGTVTFSVTVPAGVGHLQASSSFLPAP